jgi:hypothetical protein
MSVKPVSVSTLLPQGLRDTGKRPPDSNRFAVLARDRTPSFGGKLPPPSPATKRPPEDQIGPNGKEIRLDGRIFGVMEGIEKMIIKGRDDMAKAKVILEKDTEMPKSGKELLGGFASAFEHLADAVEAMASIIVDASAKQPPKGSQVKSNNMPARPAAAAAKPVVDPEEVKRKKFSQTVKDAEKSMLIFGLDLGKVQIMNTATLARNVTQDVIKKAATIEKKTDGRPSEDTVSILDDTMSMVSGMDFLGKVTRPYQNKFNVNDAANGTYCTMPVKLSFKTKEAKIRAETVFKRHCGIASSTPYHQRLRQLIGKTIQEQKEKHPGCFIQVRVDPDALKLNISRRDEKKVWTNNFETVSITPDCMDLGSVRNTTSSMEVEASQPSL